MPEWLDVVVARPWALALLPLALVPIVAHLAARRTAPRLRFPAAALLARGPAGVAARLAWLPPALLAAALALAVLALSRPESSELGPSPDAAEGIDIVLAVDVSASMRAADLRPRDRLTVAKELLGALVAGRVQDRVGLVAFAREAWTQAPVTRDVALVAELLAGLEAGEVEDGTAIGDAVATSVNRLRRSEARSKVVVLVTDGDDNSSRIPPLDAARAAAALGVKVFTVVVGRGGLVPYPVDVDGAGRPVFRQVSLPVNPELLRRIAAVTGGAHYDAVDRAALEHGLSAVLDGLERTRASSPAPVPLTVDRGPALLAWSVVLGAAALALSVSALRSFP